MTKVFVLEIGRPIKQDVEALFGHVDDILSYPSTITISQIPKIASEAYKKIMELARGGNEVAIVLSGPLALAFQLGQAIGFAHAKIQLYQFFNGKYFLVPPLTREMLFER